MTDDKLTSYGRVLRARRRVYLWCGAAGLAGVMVCLILLPDGGMPPIALAFYRGGSFGLLFAGLFQVLRTQRLLKRPERWKELRIREIDERQRHIDRDIITHFARAGTLYEDAEYHNAVFVGTDEHGVSRHAQKRSTNSQGRSFKLNVEGSDARYSFHHLGDDGDLYVFEAPIDLLSYITLHLEDWQRHSYVACCGTSYEPVRWMLTQMETPQMVSLCLDHDRAGERGSERMAEQIASEFGIPTRRLISEQKDWNEDLCAMQEHPKQGMEMKMR